MAEADEIDLDKDPGLIGRQRAIARMIDKYKPAIAELRLQADIATKDLADKRAAAASERTARS